MCCRRNLLYAFDTHTHTHTMYITDGWTDGHKDEVHPVTGHEGPESEWRYSSTLSLTSELDGVENAAPPAALPPGKRPGANLAQARSGRVRKISPPPGFDPRNVQLVASRCTD